MNPNCVWERLECQVMSWVSPLTKESKVYPWACNQNCFWILAIKINISKAGVLISLMLRLSVLNYAQKGTGTLFFLPPSLPTPKQKNKGAGKIVSTRAALQRAVAAVGIAPEGRCTGVCHLQCLSVCSQHFKTKSDFFF